MSCRDHLVQLRKRKAELNELNVAVAVVTFDAGWVARAYVDETKPSWPVLIDSDRSLYRAYGMAAGRLTKLLGPRAIWFYLKVMLRGGRIRLPTADVKQLGGNVLIDPTGIVRLHVVAEDAAGRPSVDDMLKVVRLGTSPSS